MSNATEHFFAAMHSGDFANAAKLFCAFSLDQQEGILESFMANKIIRSQASQKPTILAVLQRQLKDNVSYDEFYQAWQPSKPDHTISQDQHGYDYYHLPVRVITACNIDDPNQLISISMIACEDHDQLLEEFTDRHSQEQQRANKIAQVADKLADNQLFEVLSDDILGDFYTQRG